MEPFFTASARVFQIEPTARKTWLPIGKHACSVSLYKASLVDAARITCRDEDKTLIDVNFGDDVVFTKTSQKFGQWVDLKSDVIYGLGFQSEEDLAGFAMKFLEARLVDVSVKFDSKKSISSEDIAANSGGCRSLSNSSDLHMKYENDRLKAALAQSSANAKKWEGEFQILKNNNARLTAALQESMANVDKWKEQLCSFKEENSVLRKKLSDVGTNSNFGASVHDQASFESRLHEYELQLKRKEQEVARISQQGSDEVNLLREKNAELLQKVQNLQVDVEKLQAALNTKDEYVRSSKAAELKLSRARDLHALLNKKFEELENLRRQITSFLD